MTCIGRAPASFVDRRRRGADDVAPAFGAGPAIVHHDQSAAAALICWLRRPGRSRKAEDRQRQRNHAQQQQPPWRARRRLFVRLEVVQQRQRGQGEALRLRRRRAQQQPQDRQRQQADERQRLEEEDRPDVHAAPPPTVKPQARMPSGVRALLGRVVADEAPAELGGQIDHVLAALWNLSR